MVSASETSSVYRIMTVAAKWLLAVLFCALVAACGTTGSRESRPEATPRAPTLLSEAERALQDYSDRIGSAVPFAEDGSMTIALLAPISHGQAPVRELAQSLVDAAQLARNEVGLQKINLKIYDTKGLPSGAEAAANQAITDGAGLILGPLFASSTKAIKPMTQMAGLPVISFSTDVTAAGDNVYLIGFLPQQEIKRVVDYTFSQGVQSFAALTPLTDYGDVAAQAIQQATALNGAQLMTVQRYQRDFQGIEAGVKEFAPIYEAAAQTSPIKAVLLADDGQALQTLAAYLAYFDVSPRDARFIGSSVWNTPTTRKETSLRNGWFAAPDPSLVALFEQRFVSTYARKPHALGGLAFDAIASVGAMVSEARAAGNPYPFMPEAITHWRGFAGVNGIFRFLPDGQNERGLAILQVNESNFTVIDPAPTSFEYSGS
ncbi:MAG: penicillin-binding protein activator [Neomegalonema sp.]|nr:penicillin-binding protein activator [Neomegalonema sp.]